MIKDQNNDDYHAEPYEDDPVIIPLVKRKGVGRNDPCPCNSGEKYKNCHEKASKMLMPREMSNLLKVIVHKLNGVTITQRALDNFPEGEVDVNITFREDIQAWQIRPDVKESLIVTPQKEPMIPTRRIIKSS